MNSRQKVYFSVTFELMDDEYDGIDVILKYSIPSRSVLVTARSEELAIQGRCSQAGIMVLPKAVVNYVKINMIEQSVVLIDDDRLIRLDWKNFFESRKIKFVGFTSIDSFIEGSSQLEKDSLIYIDSILGGDVRGEIESEKIYMLGFKNLFISTGYQKQDIQKPVWIKDIHSKNPRNLKLFRV